MAPCDVKDLWAGSLLMLLSGTLSRCFGLRGDPGFCFRVFEIKGIPPLRALDSVYLGNQSEVVKTPSMVTDEFEAASHVGDLHENFAKAMHQTSRIASICSRISLILVVGFQGNLSTIGIRSFLLAGLRM